VTQQQQQQRRHRGDQQCCGMLLLLLLLWTACVLGCKRLPCNCLPLQRQKRSGPGRVPRACSCVCLTFSSLYFCSRLTFLGLMSNLPEGQLFTQRQSTHTGRRCEDQAGKLDSPFWLLSTAVICRQAHMCSAGATVTAMQHCCRRCCQCCCCCCTC
jgi:hypothetical protein